MLKSTRYKSLFLLLFVLGIGLQPLHAMPLEELACEKEIRTHKASSYQWGKLEEAYCNCYALSKLSRRELMKQSSTSKEFRHKQQQKIIAVINKKALHGHFLARAIEEKRDYSRPGLEKSCK